jgi:hypothetical protein
MDTAHEIGTKGCMNRPVPLDPAHLLENRRPDQHIEMSFPTLAVTRMAPMAFAVIDNFEVFGGKCRRQPRLNFLSNAHFSPDPL